AQMERSCYRKPATPNTTCKFEGRSCLRNSENFFSDLVQDQCPASAVVLLCAFVNLIRPWAAVKSAGGRRKRHGRRIFFFPGRRWILFGRFLWRYDFWNGRVLGTV